MSLTLAAYQVVRRASKPTDAPADGSTVDVTCGTVPGGQTWRVEGLTVASSSSTVPLVYIYDATPAQGLVPADATRYGTFTVDDRASPITLLAGDQLVVEFRGVSAGAVCRVRVQYVVYVGTPVAPTPVAI